MPMPAVIIGTSAYESLPPETRRLYKETVPTADGDSRYELDIDVGENFEGFLGYPETGPLVRALHRQQAEGAELKAKIAKLEATGGVSPSVLDLVNRREAIYAAAAASGRISIPELKARNAAEIAEIERSTAAEIQRLRTERESMEKRLYGIDQTNALKAAITRAGIKPQFHNAVTALLREHVVMMGDKAMATTPFGTMTLDDFVARWAQGEDGEPYRDPAAGRLAKERIAPNSFSARVKNLR